MSLVSPISFETRNFASRRGEYFVRTWGCQMNEEDSEQMARHMESIGFAPAESWLTAQVVLLNTCSVRKKPEDKAFSFLGELDILKKRRPDLVVGVCGCMAQLRSAEIKKRAPFVDFVVGTGQISMIPGLVEESLQRRKFQSRTDLPERKGAVVTDIPRRLIDCPSATSTTKVKCFVPIQYGCDKFCTFCIVPTTRGRERSRPTEDIVSEVRALAEKGTKEVTLLGQTVNSYGKNMAEGRVPFSKLLWLLAGLPGLERIRYTSPYPRDFKTDLIECIRDNPKVVEHVHLPLQSGDNEMLKLMKRQYSSESFLQIVEELRTAVPTIAITTDIIVGYPTESEEQFQRTLDMIETVRFDGAYMFIYSPRPGTPAGGMEQLPYALKQARLKLLADRQNEITVEKNRDWIGRSVEVLVEGVSPRNPNMWQGYSREYKMIHFGRRHGAANEVRPGDLVQVELIEAKMWGLIGVVR